MFPPVIFESDRAILWPSRDGEASAIITLGEEKIIHCVVMLCYVMLCYVMLCYVMLCCAILLYRNEILLIFRNGWQTYAYNTLN